LLPVLVPWRAALVIAGLSVATATLAGVGPALRALRVRVVEAIAYE
jgi:ABC-type lipoprotein release transport system permease subunit